MVNELLLLHKLLDFFKILRFIIFKALIWKECAKVINNAHYNINHIINYYN